MRPVEFLCCLIISICLWFVHNVDCQGKDLVPPIKNYIRGYKDRVEYIVAEIHKSDLDKGSVANNAARNYVKIMSPSKGDDAGHLIAQRLGGTGKKTYNIVPQNFKANRGAWRTRIEKPVYDDVNKGNTVIFEVWPLYKDSRATRPYSLQFAAKRIDGTVILPIGTMPNPIP